MATTTAPKNPHAANDPTAPGNVIENQLGAAPAELPAQPAQETQRQPSATEVINAVLAEDEAKPRPQGALAEALGSKSRTSSRSRSRSRPTSAAGSRRGSTSVWDNDPEKKQRKLVEKIFGHRWTPDFLK